MYKDTSYYDLTSGESVTRTEEEITEQILKLAEETVDALKDNHELARQDMAMVKVLRDRKGSLPREASKRSACIEAIKWLKGERRANLHG